MSKKEVTKIAKTSSRKPRKRLQKYQAYQKTRADAKQGKTKSACSKPSKKAAFFAGLKADAPQTVQQSIPYREMYRDGICRLTDAPFTPKRQFFDINYQLAQADDKAQIFEGYYDFLNYLMLRSMCSLPLSTSVPICRILTEALKSPPRGDEYDGIRKEYGDMLKNQLQKGNNGPPNANTLPLGSRQDDLRIAKNASGTH